VQPDAQAEKKGTHPMLLLAQKLGQYVTLLTLQEERSPLKAVAPENILSMLVTLATAQDERSPLKAVAAPNIYLVLVTFAVFQEERSPLKADTP
jgi:hypothetical protein